MAGVRVQRLIGIFVFAALLVPAVAAAQMPVGCVVGVGGRRDAAEVRVRGQAVIPVQFAAGGHEAAERCHIIAERLAAVLYDDSGRPEVKPDIVSGEIVVKAGDQVLVTVVESAARHYGTTRAALALQWANNVRKALGLAPLPEPRQLENVVAEQGSNAGTVMRASWYGSEFAGRRTASGERFDPSKLTAAHRTLPFGTRLRISAPWSGTQVIVRVNDRGPWAGGRQLDLSQEAARRLGMLSRGVGDVVVEVLPN